MPRGVPKLGFRRDKKSVPNIERGIEIACKRMSQRALMVLDKAMDERLTPDLDYKTRVMAAKEILDRGWGRPKQSVENTVINEMGDKFLEALRGARQRAALPDLTIEAEVVEIPTIPSLQ